MTFSRILLDIQRRIILVLLTSTVLLLALPAIAEPPLKTIHLVEFRSVPSPAIAGKDFRLIFRWNAVPDEVALRMISPSGVVNMSRTLPELTEVDFSAQVYMKHLQERGVYSLEITAQKSGYAELRTTATFALVDQEASQDLPPAQKTPRIVSPVRVSPTIIYLREDLLIQLKTEPADCRVIVEIIGPDGERVPSIYEGGRDGNEYVSKTVADWKKEGTYTVRCSAENSAGESEIKQERFTYHNYLRSEKDDYLKIVRISPQPVHAGQDVTVIIKKSLPDMEVQYEVGKTAKNIRSVVGRSAEDIFQFNSSKAASELSEDGEYEIELSARTPGGRPLVAKEKFRYLNTPDMKIECPLTGAENIIGLAPGRPNVIPLRVTNRGGVAFSGALVVEGPPEFTFSVENGLRGAGTITVPIEIPASGTETIYVQADVPGNYSTGQADDYWDYPKDIFNVSPSINPVRDPTDRIDISLNRTGQKKGTGVLLSLRTKSTGGNGKGSLTVSVEVDPLPLIGQRRMLAPGSPHTATVRIMNSGETLLFVREFKLTWPACLRPLPGGSVHIPKLWEQRESMQGLATSLLGALADPTSVTDDPLIEKISDIYMAKYLLKFAREQKIGIGLPPGEAMVISIPFRAPMETCSTSISADVLHVDSGIVPAPDFSTGASATYVVIKQVERDLLAGDTALAARLTSASTTVQIRQPVFSEEIDSVLEQLGEAAAGIRDSLLAWGFGFLVGIHSPADLHIYDRFGNHTGINYETGEFENDIPSAEIIQAGEAVYIFVPDSAGAFRVVTRGRADGTYDLDMLRPAVVRLKDGSFERVIIPFRYSGVQTTTHQEITYCPDVIKIGQTASQHLENMNIDEALRAALATPTDGKADEKTPSEILLYFLIFGGIAIAVAIAFVLVRSFAIRRNNARNRGSES